MLSDSFHQSHPYILAPVSAKQKHLPVILSPRHCFAEYDPSFSQDGLHSTTSSKWTVCKHEARKFKTLNKLN